jgi:hypothetical protein
MTRSPGILETLHLAASLTLGGSAVTAVGVVVVSVWTGEMMGGKVFLCAVAIAIGSTFVTSTIQRIMFGGRRRNW